jgi:hypothetical protein
MTSRDSLPRVGAIGRWEAESEGDGNYDRDSAIGNFSGSMAEEVVLVPNDR